MTNPIKLELQCDFGTPTDFEIHDHGSQISILFDPGQPSEQHITLRKSGEMFKTLCRFLTIPEGEDQ